MSQYNLLRESSGGSEQPYAPLASSPTDDAAPVSIPHLPLYEHRGPHALSPTSSSHQHHPSRLEPLHSDTHEHAAVSGGADAEWEEKQRPCKHGHMLLNCISCMNAERQQQPQQQQHSSRQEDHQPTLQPQPNSARPSFSAPSASSHPTHLSQLIPHTSHFLLSVVEARGSSPTDAGSTSAIVVHPSLPVSHLIERMQARLAPTSLRPSRRHAAVEHELYALQRAANLAEWMVVEEREEGNAESKVQSQGQLNAPQPSAAEQVVAEAAAARRKLRVDARRRGRVVPLLRALLREGLVVGVAGLEAILSYRDLLHRSASTAVVADVQHVPDGVIRAQTMASSASLHAHTRHHAEEAIDQTVEELLFQLREQSLPRMAAELSHRVKASAPDAQGYRPGERDAGLSARPSERCYVAPEVRPPAQTESQQQPTDGGEKKSAEQSQLAFSARAWCDGSVLRKEDTIAESHITAQSTVYLLFTSRYHTQSRAVAYHHTHRGGKLHDSYAIFVRHQPSRSLVRVHVHVSTKVWQVKHVATRTCYELTEAEMEALDADKDRRMGRMDEADEPQLTARQSGSGVEEESKEQPPDADALASGRSRKSTVIQRHRSPTQAAEDAADAADAADADDVEHAEHALESPAERCVLLLHGRVLYDNDAMVFSGVGPGDVLVVLDKHDKADTLIDARHYGALAGQPQLCDAQLVDRSTLFDVQAAVCQVREYVEAVVHCPAHKQRLWTYFKLMDVDHSGEMRPPELSWALHTVLRLLQQRLLDDDASVTQQWLVDPTSPASITSTLPTSAADTTEATYGFDEPSVLPPHSETSFHTFLRLLVDSLVELVRARSFDLMLPAQTFDKPDWWHAQHKRADGGGETRLSVEDKRRLHDNHRLMHTIFSTLPHLGALPTRQTVDSTAETGTPRDLTSAVPEHMHAFLSRAGLSPDFALNHSTSSRHLNRAEGEAANVEHAYILTQLLQAEQERQQKEGAHHNIHRGPTFDARRRHDSALDSILRHLDLALTEDLELDEADHEPKHLNAYFYTGVLAVATFVLQPLVESYEAVRQLWEKSFPLGWWAKDDEARLSEREQASEAECRRLRESLLRGDKAQQARLELAEREHRRDLEELWRCRLRRGEQLQRFAYGIVVIFLFTVQRAAFFYTPFASLAVYHLYCAKDSLSHITLLEAWVPFAITCLLMAYSVNDAVTDRLELDADDEERVRAAFRDSQLLCKEMRSSPVMLDFSTPAAPESEEAKRDAAAKAGKRGEEGDKRWNVDRFVGEGKQLIATTVKVGEHVTGVNHSNKAQHRSLQHGTPGSPRHHHDAKPNTGKATISTGAHDVASAHASQAAVAAHVSALPREQVLAARAVAVDEPARWWQCCLSRRVRTSSMAQPLDGGSGARVAPFPTADASKPPATAHSATTTAASTALVNAGPVNAMAERKTSRLRMSEAVLNFRLGSPASQSAFLWWQKLLFLALTVAHTVVPGAYRVHVEGGVFFDRQWYDMFVAIGNFFAIPAVYMFLTALGEACLGYYQLTVRLRNMSTVASAAEAYEAKMPYFLDIRQPNNLEYWLALRERAKHVEARLLAMMAGAVVGDAVLLVVSAVRVLFYKVTVDLLLVLSIADIVLFSLFIAVFLLIVVQANTVLSVEHVALLQRLKHALSFELVNSAAWDSITLDVNEDDGRNIDTWSDGCVFDAEEAEEEEELREMESAILDAEGSLTNHPSRRASLTTSRRQSTFSRSSSPRYPSGSPRHKRCPHDLPAADCMTCTLKSHSSSLHQKQTLKLHSVHSLLATLSATCQSVQSHSLVSLRYYRFSLQAQLLNSTIEHLQAMDEPVKLLGLLVDQKLLMQALAAIVTAGAGSLSSLISNSSGGGGG